ncbi:hypothetical protein FOZ63_023995, partial [Perkinsus olseni]
CQADSVGFTGTLSGLPNSASYRYHIAGSYRNVPVSVLNLRSENRRLIDLNNDTMTSYTMSSTGCAIQPKLSKSQTAQLVKKYPDYIEATTLANLQCSTSGGFTIAIDYK